MTIFNQIFIVGLGIRIWLKNTGAYLLHAKILHSNLLFIIALDKATEKKRLDKKYEQVILGL